MTPTEYFFVGTAVGASVALAIQALEWIFAGGRSRWPVAKEAPAPAVPGPRDGELVTGSFQVEMGDAHYVQEPAGDIWPKRLADLALNSGLFAGKHSTWTGTAVDLRAALLGLDSRLYYHEKREIPPPDAIAARLQSMMGRPGRLQVELVGHGDAGQVWKLSLART